MNIHLCLMFNKQKQLQLLLEPKSQSRLCAEMYPYIEYFSFKQCMHHFESFSLLETPCNESSSSEELQEKTGHNFQYLARVLWGGNQYVEALEFFEKTESLLRDFEKKKVKYDTPLLLTSCKCSSFEYCIDKNSCSVFFNNCKYQVQQRISFQLTISDNEVLNRNKLDLWLDMGCCWFDWNKPDKALQYFEKVLQMQLLLRCNEKKTS